MCTVRTVDECVIVCKWRGFDADNLKFGFSQTFTSHVSGNEEEQRTKQ